MRNLESSPSADVSPSASEWDRRLDVVSLALVGWACPKVDDVMGTSPKNTWGSLLDAGGSGIPVPWWDAVAKREASFELLI